MMQTYARPQQLPVGQQRRRGHVRACGSLPPYAGMITHFRGLPVTLCVSGGAALASKPVLPIALFASLADVCVPFPQHARPHGFPGWARGLRRNWSRLGALPVFGCIVGISVYMYCVIELRWHKEYPSWLTVPPVTLLGILQPQRWVCVCVQRAPPPSCWPRTRAGPQSILCSPWLWSCGVYVDTEGRAPEGWEAAGGLPRATCGVVPLSLANPAQPARVRATHVI
jgi:hypothetical protein